MSKEGQTREASKTFESNLKHLEDQKKYSSLYVANLALLSTTYLELGENENALETSTNAHQLVTLPNNQDKEFRPYIIAAIKAEHAKVLAANDLVESALDQVNSAIDFFEENGGNDLAENLILRSYLNALWENHDVAKSDIEIAMGILSQAENFDDSDSAFLLAKSMQLYSDLKSEWDNSTFDELAKQWQRYLNTQKGKRILSPYTVIGTFIRVKG